MDVTSLIELILAIVVALLAYIVLTRLRRLEDTVYAVTGENEALQAKVAALQAQIDKNQLQVEPSDDAPAQPDTAPAAQPAPAQPAVTPDTAAPEASESVAPEVVAVIMATIAAYGYSPSAIRSIRPTRQVMRQQQNWIMAGRMASMR